MTQSRVQHQQVVEEVEVPIPMQQEEVIHVPKIQTATRQVQQHVEQVVEVPIHQKREEVVHVPKVVTHTRTSHQHVEQTVEAPGLTTKRLEKIRNPPEKRLSLSFWHVAQVPVPMTQEEHVHVPKIMTQTSISAAISRCFTPFFSVFPNGLIDF